MNSILVTGGAGFIGSNFIGHILNDKKNVVYNLDNLTYAGNKDNLISFSENPRYKFIKGDICDRNLIEEIFRNYSITKIIHFAAESHVDNSIKDPGIFIKTNVLGTFTLLDVAYKSWMNGPFSTKDDHQDSRFLHVSTDEVYGTLGETGLFTESTPYAPNSPYSASKASSDMIVRSYYHTFGLNVVTTNCSNNYGPMQHNEKFIPTIIRKAISNDPIPVYGDGKNIRDWLYVLDHCKGIELVLNNGEKGETYNIGGRNERDNLYIVKTVCELLDEIVPRENGLSYKQLVTFVTDRPGHDFRYAIDASKIENELNWKADENFESGIKKTVFWYLNKFDL